MDAKLFHLHFRRFLLLVPLISQHATDLMKYKVVPLKFNDFLHSTGGKVLLYVFVAYA